VGAPAGPISHLITNELRQALRRLRRAPMFTVIRLFTPAAGVGANTVVFSLLGGVLLKPLPYPRHQSDF
jgi:putative ABC transport system permease protein